jgi:hypothetical protein
MSRVRPINYMLNQRQALAYHCEDRMVEIHNTIAKNALRGCCLGRKHFRFIGADNGGERAAAMTRSSAAPGLTALIRRPICATC